MFDIASMFIESSKLADLYAKYETYKMNKHNRTFCEANHMDDELYQLCVQSIHLSNLDELLKIAKKKNDKVAKFVFSTAIEMKKVLENGI